MFLTSDVEKEIKEQSELGRYSRVRQTEFCYGVLCT